MKKFMLMFALLVSAVMSANAQVATQNRKAFDNISVGVVAGVSTPLDFNSMFPLNAAVGVRVQKDFTPIFGLQAEGLVLFNDNHFSDVKTFVKATNVGLNGVFNLTNAFKGYKGTPRVFEINLVAGLGWLHNWTLSTNSLTAKTGLDLAFNLGEKKAHTIVLSPAIYWNLNKFNKVEFNKKDAQLALMVGYIYHFKTSNGTHHFKTYNVDAMNAEINTLKEKLDECEKREPKVVEKVVEKVVVIKDASNATTSNDTFTVTFDKAKSDLSAEAKSVLDSIGNDAIVNIEGEASPEGAKWFNKKLAKDRANAVKAYLVKRGVRVDKVTTKTNAKRAAIVTNAQ